MAGMGQGRLHHALFAEVGQGINPEVGGDLLQGEPGGDQLVLGVGVDAVEAGVGDRR